MSVEQQKQALMELARQSSDPTIAENLERLLATATPEVVAELHATFCTPLP